MKGIIRIIDLNNKFLSFIIGFIAITMFVLVFSQVILRYVLNSSLSWSEELARYLMIWAIFLGAAVAFRRGLLVSIELMKSMVPSKIFRYIQVLVYIVCVLFFFTLFIYGIEMVGNVKAQTSPSLNISMAIPYACVPISALILILNSIVLIFEEILNMKHQKGLG